MGDHPADGHLRTVRQVMELGGCDHPEGVEAVAEDASGWEDRVASGTGQSRGVELSIEKSGGNTTGSPTHTLFRNTFTAAASLLGRSFTTHPNDCISL